MLQICERIQEGNWKIDHVPKGGSYITKNDKWASFNDVIDIEEKADWIVNQKFGGASVFINQDDWDNKCACGPFPLLSSINRIFKKVQNIQKCYI